MTRASPYQYSIVTMSVAVFLAVSTQYTNVTDTARCHRPRLYVHRAAKIAESSNRNSYAIIYRMEPFSLTLNDP